MSGRTLRPALLVNHLKGGGKEQFVITLANALRRRGHAPVVVCFETGGKLAQRLDAGVPLVALGKKKGNAFGLPLAILRTLRQYEVDVVHSNNWGTLLEGVVAARLYHRARVLHTQHGLDFERGATRKGMPRRLIAKRLAARLLDGIAAVNDEVRQMVVDEWRVSPDRIRVIANGVALPEAGILSPDERAARRATAGFDAAAFIVGSVGYLRPVKDYPVLVEAFAHLYRQRADALLVLIGEGPSRHDIAAAARRHGVEHRVQLLGSRQDVQALLPLFDVFALSSLSEGISLAILEAMAAGLPVVATRVGGNPVIVDGSSGVLVPASSAYELGEALTALAGDDERRVVLGEAGRERVYRRFSDDRMAADYEQAYDAAH